MFDFSCLNEFFRRRRKVVGMGSFYKNIDVVRLDWSICWVDWRIGKYFLLDIFLIIVFLLVGLLFYCFINFKGIRNSMRIFCMFFVEIKFVDNIVLG